MGTLSERLNKKNMDRVLSYVKRNGPKETCYKIAERLKRDSDEKNYKDNVLMQRPSHDELVKQRKYVFEMPYKISILVPTYETNPVFLKQMLCSVVRQTYQNWELCIADGSRSDVVKNVVMKVIGEEYDPLLGSKIKYQKLTENKGISGNTNAALSMACGDYIALLDHDDILEENALFEVMKVLEESSYREGSITLNNALMIYTDEDKINADMSNYFDYHSKPGFDIDLLRSNNYICHFLVVESSIATKTGGFRPEYDGAQDHDFIFRCVEHMKPENIRHIDKVLYHWRASEDSSADNPDSKVYAFAAAKRAIEDHLKRCGLFAEVSDTSHLGFFRVKYLSKGKKCLTLTRDEYDSMSDEEIKASDADAFMIMNENIEPLTEDYEQELLGILSRKEVLAVTGKIIDKHNRIESAGYSFNENGEAVPDYCGMNFHYSGYMHRASIQHKTEGLPCDCMMVKTEAVIKYGKGKISDKYICVYDPFAVFRRK
ncbi:MAG: glycosyltransferase [Lachnospiraceae bacterium]|nr:glycosyltransferase [Lachnospiraceae bacterium]